MVVIVFPELIVLINDEGREFCMDEGIEKEFIDNGLVELDKGTDEEDIGAELLLLLLLMLLGNELTIGTEVEVVLEFGGAEEGAAGLPFCMFFIISSCCCFIIFSCISCCSFILLASLAIFSCWALRASC